LLRMRGVPMHIGLVVRAGQMLHIADEANSCLEDYRTSVWARRVLGFYRYG
jgi:cell wall-associated NlpC family hydrolase